MDPGASSKPGAYGTLKDPAELSVMRVNQLDAGVLDTELHSLLKTQLGRACSGLPAGTLERFKPEVWARMSQPRPPTPSRLVQYLGLRCVVVLMLARRFGQPSFERPVEVVLPRCRRG